jgi:hypothetical protein
MDILTGDPFYHNIIYHLSRSSLHVLKYTCKYFNKNINNTLINKVTINNIKNQLHKSFGNTYEENMKKIKQLESNKNVVHKGKYFVVSVCVCDDKYDEIDDWYVVTKTTEGLDIKDYYWTISTREIAIRKTSCVVLVIESLDENSIHIPEIKKNAWGSHNKWFDMFWIETDNSEEFNLLEHL